MSYFPDHWKSMKRNSSWPPPKIISNGTSLITKA